jgi:hypothetical protein
VTSVVAVHVLVPSRLPLLSQISALKEYDVFEAIELVQTYEKDMFGEVNTDLSNPENLINMLYYIIGDEVIGEMNEIDEFNDNWDYEADEETNKVIIEKMKEMFDI